MVRVVERKENMGMRVVERKEKVSFRVVESGGGRDWKR